MVLVVAATGVGLWWGFGRGADPDNSGSATAQVSRRDFTSTVLATEALLRKGKPSHIHIVSIMASKEGIETVRQKLSRTKTTIWVGAIDDELTSQAYIVPGLGDACHLAYGRKSDDQFRQ